MRKNERPILFNGKMVRAILDGRKTQTRRIIKPQPELSDRYGFAWKNKCFGLGADHSKTLRNFVRQCPYGTPAGKESTAFRDAQPPCDGWYRVALEPGDDEKLMHLQNYKPEWAAESPVDGWMYRENEADEPEALYLDIADPLAICWRAAGTMLWVRETFMDLRGTGLEYPAGDGHAYAADTEPGSFADDCRKDFGLKWKPSIHMPRRASRILLEVTGVRVERLQDISEEDAQAEGNGIEFGSYRAGFCDLWESINGLGSWGANPWVWVIEFRKVDG